MNIVLRTTLLALIAVCLFPVPADSFQLTARFSSDFYAYQASDQDHLRPYFRFRGNMYAWHTSPNRFLRLHTSLRWTSDFTNKLPSDPTLFVYDGYAHLAGVVPRTDLYLGRQFVYTGVGSALLDGGKARFRIVRYLSLDVFGGSSVSSENPETVRAFGDFLVLGSRLGVKPGGCTRIGLSWMLKRNDGYASFHRVGIDANCLFGSKEIFGRVSYNSSIHRLSGIQARATYRPGGWYFSGEYYWREPSVSNHSIFTLVDFYRYQIARVEANRRIFRGFSLTTHAQADLSGGDDPSWRTGIGIRSSAYSLTWIHQTGDGGDNNGLSGSANLSLKNGLDCYASANVFRYRVQLEQAQRSDAYASTLGVRWRPGHGVTIRLEGQHLRNAVYKNDRRVFLRIAKDISIGSLTGSNGS